MHLELRTCTIRSWLPADAKSLVHNANNANVAAHLRDRFPHPYTDRDAREWLRLAASESPETNFAIEVDGEACGGIGVVLHEDVYRGNAEIGYWLGEGYWGRGIVSEAVAAFSDWIMEQFPEVHRLYAGVFSGNPASARVLEKAGYILEATLRESITKGGKRLDELVYARRRQ